MGTGQESELGGKALQSSSCEYVQARERWGGPQRRATSQRAIITSQVKGNRTKPTGWNRMGWERRKVRVQALKPG